MADAADIRALYAAYIEKAETLERDRKPGEGLLGLKKGPADDPCHGRFAEELEAAVADYAAQPPAPAEAAALLSYMFDVPQAHREPVFAYWMLIAVQGLSLPLIDGLDPADADALFRIYEKTYPRWERLPVQKKVLAALRKKRGK